MGCYVAPFEWGPASLPRDRVPADAIPDLGENQQIVFTRWPGHSPRDLEDQVSYPLNTALLGIPGVRTVRSSSLFGFSTIHVIFKEGIDFYWARTRILEKLSSLPKDTLPYQVTPTLGPDATALGQVFWYTLESHDPQGKVIGGWDLHELRSIQDWSIRFALQSVPGVAEVTSIGGHVREYQVDVDPVAMLAHGVSLDHVATAVRESNLDISARTLEINQTEYVVRGLGFIKSIEDLEETVIHTRDQTPIRIRDVARVGLGPAQRRGALDEGGAEVVGGVVVMRYGENPLEVIQRIHEKIAELSPGLPRRTLEDGTLSQVKVVPFYDRSSLIQQTLGTLFEALRQQLWIVLLVVLLLLGALRGALLIAVLPPLAVLGTFAAMKYTGVQANVMALAGIAIAIGTMVDMGIVLIENIATRLQEARPGEKRLRITARATAEVAPAVLTSTLTTLVSFLPVFALTATEGKLFTPLAYTKSFAIASALFIALILLPALAGLLLRGPPAPNPKQKTNGPILQRIKAKHLILPGTSLLMLPWNTTAGGILLLGGLLWITLEFLPKSYTKILTKLMLLILAGTLIQILATDWMPLREAGPPYANLVFVFALVITGMLLLWIFQRAYPVLLSYCLRHPWSLLALATLLIFLGSVAWLGIGAFSGPIPEKIRQTSLFHRITQIFPGLQREFMPPFDEGSYIYMPTTMPHASMGQTLAMLSELDRSIQAIPEVDRVIGKLGRTDSALDPAPISMFEILVNYHPEYSTNETGQRVRLWRDHIQNPRDIWQEISTAAQAPGLTGSPLLMPINTRLLMLQSGVRAPLAIKIQGATLASMETFGLRLEETLKAIPSIRPETLVADRLIAKPYVEIDLDREALGRYGISIRKVQNIIQIALGGQILTHTIEGRERYPVRVRYLREERDSLDALKRVLVPAPENTQIPLEQLATIRYVKGPRAIQSENTALTSHVVFDSQPGYTNLEVIEQMQAHLKQQIQNGSLQIPTGISYQFVGDYEQQLRSEQHLKILVPLALLLVFLLLYLQFRSTGLSLIAYSGTPLCLAGGFLLLWIYSGPFLPDISFFDTSLHELARIGSVHLSVATWVGFIALLGIATDTGVLLVTCMEQHFKSNPPKNKQEIHKLVLQAAQRRLRPCLMTTATTALALLPIITSQGRGADVMLPMALPIAGGMATLWITLFTVPVLYALRANSRHKNHE